MSRSLPLLLALTATTLLLPTPVHAGVIIDSFTVDSESLLSPGGPGSQSSQIQTVIIQNQNATRSLSVGAPVDAKAEGQVTNGSYGFISNPAAGGSTDGDYSGFVLDATDTPFLKFSLLELSGHAEVAIELESTGSPGAIATFFDLPIDFSGPTELFVDIRGFPDFQSTFLTGLNKIKIGLQNLQGFGSMPEFFIKLDEISLATQEEFEARIPEPSSFVLLTIVLGAFGKRYRLRLSR